MELITFEEIAFPLFFEKRLKKDKIFLARDSKGKRLVVKITTHFELKVYEFLQKVRGKRFNILVLPKILGGINIIKDNLTLIFVPYYKGDIHKWDERDARYKGGKRIPLSTVDDIILLLEDFLRIKIDEVPSFIPRFDFRKWYRDIFEKYSYRLAKDGLLSKHILERVSKRFKHLLEMGDYKAFFKTRVFTNGDFYFRNFLYLKGKSKKIVVIDWAEPETAQVSPSVEPLSVVGSYVYVLMWENPLWQERYKQKLKERFKLCEEEWRLSLAIKAFNQMVFYLCVTNDYEMARNMQCFFNEYAV